MIDNYGWVMLYVSRASQKPSIKLGIPSICIPLNLCELYVFDDNTELQKQSEIKKNAAFNLVLIHI